MTDDIEQCDGSWWGGTDLIDNNILSCRTSVDSPDRMVSECWPDFSFTNHDVPAITFHGDHDDLTFWLKQKQFVAFLVINDLRVNYNAILAPALTHIDLDMSDLIFEGDE